MDEVAEADVFLAETTAVSGPAFEEFFADEVGRLQRALALITGSRSDAEDIA